MLRPEYVPVAGIEVFERRCRENALMKNSSMEVEPGTRWPTPAEDMMSTWGIVSSEIKPRVLFLFCLITIGMKNSDQPLHGLFQR